MRRRGSIIRAKKKNKLNTILQIRWESCEIKTKNAAVRWTVKALRVDSELINARRALIVMLFAKLNFISLLFIIKL